MQLLFPLTPETHFRYLSEFAKMVLCPLAHFGRKQRNEAGMVHHRPSSLEPGLLLPD